MIINMNGAKAPETPSPTLQEKTVTPETLPTVIGADEGYDGLSQVTVNPDAQLKAENIRSGKSIFGVEGAFVGDEVHTDSIFPVLTDMKTNIGNFSIERPTILSKQEAVLLDNVGKVSDAGRIDRGNAYCFKASDRSLMIGYCQKGTFTYGNNFPASIDAIDSTSVPIQQPALLYGKKKCKIEYVVFPLITSSSYNVGSYVYVDLTYSAATEIHRYVTEVDINNDTATVSIPEIPASTVYYTSPSSSKPSGTFYCYWCFNLTILEAIE